MNKKKPELIYKFVDFNVQSLLGLQSNSIYFGSPKNFNDPYDCAIKPEISTPTDKQLEDFYNDHLSEKDTTEKVRLEFEEMKDEKRKNFIKKPARSILNKHIEEFRKERGVSCFSEINDDLLMWAHYGGNHKGFCLEFSTEEKLFDNLKPVHYVESIPKIDPLSALFDDDDKQYMNLFRTKSKDWKYEKEWRLLHPEAGIKYHYPVKSLRGIYFGSEIEEEALEIICLIIQGKNPDVLFWRGVRDEGDFKIEFKKFKYTSYIQSKAQGLL